MMKNLYKCLFRFLYDVSSSILLFSYFSNVSSQNVQKKICRTKQCSWTSEYFKQLINYNLDPCDDFYQYACGSWSKMQIDTKLSEDKLNNILIRMKHNEEEILDYLEEESGDNEPEAVRKARRFHASCMNQVAHRGGKVDPIKNILNSIGLPTLWFDNINNFDYTTALAKAVRITGGEIYFSFDVAKDRRNISLNIITLDKSTEFQKNTVFRTGFIEKVTNKMCKQYPSTKCKMWLTPFKPSLSAMLENFFHYATKINKTISSKPLSSTPASKVYTLKTLQDWTNRIAIEANTAVPKLNWTRYIEEIFSGLDNVSLNLSDSAKVEILITDPNYIENMLRLIHESKDTNIIALALWWKVISKILPYIDYEIFDFINAPKDRKKSCYALTLKLFPMAASYIYAVDAKYLNAKKQLSTMFEQIRETFKRVLKEASWMDELTRKKALQKLEAMKAYIIYPSYYSTPSNLDDLYEDFKVTDNLYETMISIIQFKTAEKLKVLNQLNNINKNDSWRVSPDLANALYFFNINTLIIPGGYVGSHLWFDHNLRVLTYGAIGTTISHEITHGFDTLGRCFNEDGEKENWWQPETSRMYQKKSKCFVDAYGDYKTNYTGKKHPENDTTTLSEDISDNNGFKLALLTYKRNAARIGDKQLYLPRFENFTNDQLFVLSFANKWCEHEVTRQFNMKSSHSPNEIRVNGVLRNSKEFAEIWNCATDRRMNPKEKCSMW